MACLYLQITSCMFLAGLQPREAYKAVCLVTASQLKSLAVA